MLLNAAFLFSSHNIHSTSLKHYPAPYMRSSCKLIRACQKCFGQKQHSQYGLSSILFNLRELVTVLMHSTTCSRLGTLSMMGLMSPRFRSSAKSLRRPATNSALNDRLRLRSVDPIRLALLRSRTPRLALSARAPAQPASEDHDIVHTVKVCSAQSQPIAFVCLTLKAGKHLQAKFDMLFIYGQRVLEA